MDTNTSQENPTLNKAKEWLKAPYDIETQRQVEELIKHNKDELEDAFYKDLSFGTAGMRGIMGVGSNRLNIYTIRKATQGLCNYIKEQNHNNPSVVICFDNRKNSKLFAMETAKVCAGNNIKVFVSHELRPTPFVSFTCRNNAASAAVMITASHNPPEYNGYKVYWSDGAQVVPPHDNAIIKHVEHVKDLCQIKLADETSTNISYLDETDDKAYISSLTKLQNHTELCQQKGKDLKVIYSPLHGAGKTLMEPALKSWGFSNVTYVKEQKDPDENFTFAPSPNPEEEQALGLGIKLLKETNSDLLIATDPDADRMGACILHNDNPYILNGHQIATICTYFLLNTYSQQKRLSNNHVIISTIVTTRLLKKIADDFKVKYLETLTGFKYIGEKIKQFEESPDELEFLFGAEESYGFLYGTHARDKDAIITSCLLSEIALFQKEKSLTLFDLLLEIYNKYGLYVEKQLAIKLPGGQKALKRMNDQIQTIRENPPTQLDRLKVVEICDYLESYSLDVISGTKETIKLPKSNVLSLKIEDGSQFIIRPSGTEPKIKIYASTNQPLSKDFENQYDLATKKLQRFLDSLQTQFFSN